MSVDGRRLIRALPFVLAGVLAIGCGEKHGVPKVSVHPVSGKVVMADGKPLSGGTVVLMPTVMGGIGARGKIQADGKFELSTYTEGDGAPNGDFTVRIEADTTGGKKREFAAIYSDETASGLKARIESGTSELPEFKLVEPAPAATP